MAEYTGQNPLTVGEFYRWANRVDEAIERIEARQMEQGMTVAVLKDRADANQRSARNQGGLWGAVGGILGGLLASLGFKIGG